MPKYHTFNDRHHNYHPGWHGNPHRPECPGPNGNSHENECFPLHGITYDKIITNRHDFVTFSLADPYTQDVSISGEIDDMWLGSDSEYLYVPELKTTGSLTHFPATYANYIPRVITGTGPQIKTNLFYGGPIEVRCKLTKSTGTEVLTLTYHPKIEGDKLPKMEHMHIHGRNIKCAPIFTTQQFQAHYKDGPGADSIISSCLILEENGNKIGKIVFAEEDDPVQCEHTGNTAGEKYLTYVLWYDNGYRTVSHTIDRGYVIDKSEINSTDDTIITGPNDPIPPQQLPGMPPKVYVICSKRCGTDAENANGVYEADTSDRSIKKSDYDYS